MTTLATLTQQLESLCSEIDESGEIPNDLLERFTSIKESHEEKCSRYVGLLNTLQHNSAYYSNRAELLKRRAKTCERVEKALKERLMYQIENNPGIPFKTSDGDRIVLRENPESLELSILTSTRTFSKVLELDARLEIPLEFVDIVTIRCLNTDSVKKYLQDGNMLSWASLKRGKHVRIT